MFRAVPPTVWSAFRLMEAKDRSRENTAPMAAETSMARISNPCRVSQSPLLAASVNTSKLCMERTNSTPMNAPKIIMPSSARLIIPLRSEKTPPKATIRRGIMQAIVDCITIENILFALLCDIIH